MTTYIWYRVQMSSNSQDRAGPIENFCFALAHAHRELIDLATASRHALEQNCAPLEVQRAIEAFADTLLNHHRSEDVFFFPAFREAGRLTPADESFIAERDAEHVPIHELAVELRENAASMTDPVARERAAAIIDRLINQSASHFAAEERYLTVHRVGAIVTPQEMIAIQRHMGTNWHRGRTTG